MSNLQMSVVKLFFVSPQLAVLLLELRTNLNQTLPNCRHLAHERQQILSA